MKNGQSIVGFGRDRAIEDFYPTPPEATEALFRFEKFEGNVWECASGKGDMSKIIEKYNTCISSDLRMDESIYGEKGINFLKDYKTSIENVITNPPYKLAKEFVLTAKLLAKKKIAMLMKLVFLEGISRYDMFKDKEFPLKAVYVFCRRPTIFKESYKGNNSGLIAFAWFVWDKSYVGKPYIDWIK